MENKSFNARMLHLVHHFSIYWIVSMGVLFLLSGSEAICNPFSRVVTGIVLASLGISQVIHFFQPTRIQPNWGLVYPELSGSCYTRGRFVYRAARILSNIGIVLGMIAFFHLTTDNTKIGIPLTIIACTLYALYALCEAMLMPDQDYNWELVYPELSLGDYSENENYQSTKNDSI
jgi:uncharacterized membrane protein HdeD (DUF308 family)